MTQEFSKRSGRKSPCLEEPQSNLSYQSREVSFSKEQDGEKKAAWCAARSDLQPHPYLGLKNEENNPKHFMVDPA